jgi:ABC-type nitrate/sulfonate/bicarbonate transport system permease component
VTPSSAGAAGKAPVVRPAVRALRIATLLYVPVLFLLGWQWLGTANKTVAGVISTPAAVVLSLAAGVADGSVLTDLGASLERALLGWVITIVVAAPLAIAAGRIRIFSRVLIPVVDLLRPISPIAWIPLAMLWLGIGLASKLLIVFVVTFFVVFLNVYDAVIRIPPVLLNVCRTFTRSRAFMLAHVTLPASLRGLVLGAQYGLSTAWGGVIVAEMVGANNGVGYQMLASANEFDPTKVIAYMVLIGLVGVTLNTVFLLACRRMLAAFPKAAGSHG